MQKHEYEVVKPLRKLTAPIMALILCGLLPACEVGWLDQKRPSRNSIDATPS